MLPLWNNRRDPSWDSANPADNISYQENLSIPSSYKMMDISKDKKFMAVIDDKSLLQGYRIVFDENGIRPVSHIIRNVECKIDSYNSLFTFLSVADNSGYVAVSYAQIETRTGLFLEGSFDPKYTHCTVYKETKEDKTRSTTIPLQGRAVFIEDKLAIVGDWKLQVLDVKTFHYKYFLDLSVLYQTYEGMIDAEKLGPNMSWADCYLLNNQSSRNAIRKNGDTLIAVTRHIRNNILVTTYRENVTKVWSILDGSLIASFMSLKDEIIMAISEANQFIATYCDMTKRVKVYCTKRTLLLYEYAPKCMEDEEGDHATVHFVKFDRCKHYLLITGTKDSRIKTQPSRQPDNNTAIRGTPSINHPNQKISRQQVNQPATPVATKQTLFFEVWSMSQEKRIVYKEQVATVEPRMPLPFVIEDYHELPELKEEDSYRYFDTDFYGVYMTREYVNNTSQLRINRLPLLLKHSHNKHAKGVKKGEQGNKGKRREQDKRDGPKEPNGSQEPEEPDLTLSREGILWKTYPFRRISQESMRMRGNDDEVIRPLDDKEKSVSYLIKKGDDRFVLRFNLNMVQLWKLEEIDDPAKVDENQKFDFTPAAGKKTYQGRNAHDQAEKDEEEAYKARCVEDKEYYRTFEKSRLVYIRAFKGQHYLPLSTFREDWKLSQGKERRFQPNVSVMSDMGRILVDIEYGNQKTKDEIFLRIPKSGLEAVCEPYGSCSTSSLSTIVDPGPPMVYHEIESFSQALHYLYFFLKSHSEFHQSPEISEVTRVGTILFKKTSKLLRDLIFSKNVTNYFNTVSGSKTLAMLASFPPGQNIIYAMTKQDPCIPICPSSYPVYCKREENGIENTFSVLLEEKRYDLFQFLFNTVIINYYNEASADLYSLFDTLSVRCLSSLPELLLRCIQRLSYLPSHELPFASHMKLLEFGYLYNFTELYHLPKHRSNFITFCATGTSNLIDRIFLNKNKRVFQNKNDIFSSCKVCIIPLSNRNMLNVIAHAISVENNSFFTTGINLYSNAEFEEDYSIVEVITDNKWRKYASRFYYFTLFIQIMYFIFYSVAISFPEEIFGYIPGTPITSDGHTTIIILTVLAGVYLFIQEIIQAAIYRTSYFKSVYNYIDIATFLLPIVTYVLLRNDGTYLYEFSSATTLTLCIHFIIRLRVHRSIGILLQVVIQLTKEIYSTIVVMSMLVISFTLAFVVLLRRRDDSFFQENIEGVISSPDKNDPLDQSAITLKDESQQNLFTDPFFAFTTVWFFMYGIFDPVFSGDIGNYKMALALAILYSFSIALIILNVVIAVMNGSIDETRKRGNRNWYGHLIAVVNEIDIFWGRFFASYNPPYLYYYAEKDTVEQHHKYIVKEWMELKNALEEKQEDLE